MNKTYILNIESIVFEVTHKKMKNMRMRIKPDSNVMVSVPLQTQKSRVEEFIRSNMVWVKEHLPPKSDDTPSTAADGKPTFIYLLGEKFPIEYENGTGDFVQLKKDGVFVCSDKEHTPEEIMSCIKELQRDKFKALLPSLTAECEKMAHIKPYEWRIRDMKTKWGTCNVTDRRIWLRLELISYPIECIKTVMIHELTHFYERYHNEHFYKLMDEFYPENRKANEILDKNMFS